MTDTVITATPESSEHSNPANLPEFKITPRVYPSGTYQNVLTGNYGVRARARMLINGVERKVVCIIELPEDAKLEAWYASVLAECEKAASASVLAVDKHCFFANNRSLGDSLSTVGFRNTPEEMGIVLPPFVADQPAT